MNGSALRELALVLFSTSMISAGILGLLGFLQESPTLIAVLLAVMVVSALSRSTVNAVGNHVIQTVGRIEEDTRFLFVY